jgi:hypothetical protein
LSRSDNEGRRTFASHRASRAMARR